MASPSVKVESAGKKAMRYTGYVASFGITYIIRQVKKKKQKKSVVRQTSVKSLLFDEDIITAENLMFNSTSGAAAASHQNLEQQQQDEVMSILSWVIDDVPDLSRSSSALYSDPLMTNDMKSSMINTILDQEQITDQQSVEPNLPDEVEIGEHRITVTSEYIQQDDAKSFASFVIDDVPDLSSSSSVTLHSDPSMTSEKKSSMIETILDQDQIADHYKQQKKAPKAVVSRQSSVESMLIEDYWINTEHLVFNSTNDDAAVSQHQNLEQHQDEAMSIISQVFDDVLDFQLQGENADWQEQEKKLVSYVESPPPEPSTDEQQSALQAALDEALFSLTRERNRNQRLVVNYEDKILALEEKIEAYESICSKAIDKTESMMPVSPFAFFQAETNEVPQVWSIPSEASNPEQILELEEANEAQRQKIQALEEMLSLKDDRFNRLADEMVKLQNEFDLEAFCQSREINRHQRLIIDYEDQIRDLQEKIALYEIMYSNNYLCMELLAHEFMKLQDANDRLEQENKLSSFLTIDKGTVIDIPQYSSFASMQIEYKRIQFIDKSGICIEAAGQE